MSPKHRAATTSHPENAAPKWVKDMHVHRSHTGEFRTQDVRRVLGDQSISVKPHRAAPLHPANHVADKSNRQK